MISSQRMSQRLSKLCPWLAVLVVLLASLMIVRQELTYSQIYDESTHLAAGMEWLTLGTYTYDQLHPPLARVAIALPLRLEGDRSEGHHLETVEGTALLNHRDAYRHDLLLARLGIMPFFWLANLLIFLWMKRHFDTLSALVAVALFSFCPPVLAHASLATTDLTFSANYLLSVLAFAHLIRNPSRLSGALAGLAYGLALLSKYTQLPFFVIPALLLLVWYKRNGGRFVRLAGPLGLACIVGLFTLWAGFRFSFDNLYPASTFNFQTHSTLVGLSPARQALLLKIKVPAPPFVRGLIYAFRVGSVNRAGHDGFLLGHAYKGGKWYFFPVAILTKTPIALLILAAVGLWHSLRRRLQTIETTVLVGAIAGPLTIAMLGDLNLGLRHVLPIFPFIAMLGAIGAAVLARRTRQLAQSSPNFSFGPGTVLACALIAWEFIACTVAMPQFIPYFNEAAMPFFGRILVESDLDWGQDFYHLEQRMQGVDPKDVSLDYFGDPDILRHASATWRLPDDNPKPNEWVAVSETEFRIHPQEYAWLAGLPFERVGRSIRLYHLPDHLATYPPPLPPDVLASQHSGERR